MYNLFQKSEFENELEMVTFKKKSQSDIMDKINGFKFNIQTKPNGLRS